MSIHSTIALMSDDGTIDSVYCHFDGYPDAVGKNLLEHYNTHSAINALIQLGALSYITKDEVIAYHRDRGEELVINHFADFRDYIDNIRTEQYSYLYRPGTGWGVFESLHGISNPEDLVDLKYRVKNDKINLHADTETSHTHEQAGTSQENGRVTFDDFKKHLEYKLALQSCDAEKAYNFAVGHPDCDIGDLQDIVLANGTAEEAFMFARDVQGADIKALQNVVIERGEAQDMTAFAAEVKGADVLKLQDQVIHVGTLEDCYAFFATVDGADDESTIIQKITEQEARKSAPSITSKMKP